MKRKELLYQLGIAAGLLTIMLAAFILLQHWKVYHYTLGLFSQNYEHLASGDILQKKIPYTSLSEANFLHWDAAHYQNVRDNAYTINKEFGEACYAFFPLFPLVWNVTHLGAIGISFFNYALFAIALLLLSGVFMSKALPRKQRLMLYALALLLPGTVVFNIPYTESIFLFTFSMACYFLKKNVRWLFVFFFMLFAFTRPAITIILASLVGTDVYFALTGRTYQTTLAKIALRIVPVLLGTFAALFVQYLYSGQWFKVFEVQHNWGYQDFRIPTQFTDWSHEGYGMSVFTLLGVFLPAVYYLAASFLKKFRLKPVKQTNNEGFEHYKEYFFILSLFYLAGITLFTLFFRGGSLNGLQRYALATPFFYIVFFSLPEKLNLLRNRIKRWVLPAVLIGGIAFFELNSYGGGFSFPHMGFYLYLLCLGYILFFNNLTDRKKVIYGLLLFGFLLVWKTYLLNMFLSDGWIFT